MNIGEYIKNRRTQLELSRNALAQKAGISHTEIHRIENGERKQPSLKVLCSIADALNIPQEELLKIAGHTPLDETPAISKTFPGLKTHKQQNTVERIVDGLSRNSELTDEDLDNLYEQVEMFIEHRKNKKNS